jgi:glycerol-3-phosphate dehydrogenase (NAD(P)+)
MKIAVLGAGAWGTALAASTAARHDTLLWARDPGQAARIAADGTNERYLPGVTLPGALRIEPGFEAALDHAGQAGEQGLIVIATPTSGLREMLGRCGSTGVGLYWVCKGFEAGSGALGHEIAREVAPGARVGVLSGPSFAIEVARGQPTALVAASVDPLLRRQAVDAFHSEALRVYTSLDPVGVEVGGAVKNVIAIATGIADGMPSAAGSGLGLNARAALVTRGLAEITRLGMALGARTDTFMGLSGLGDLVLTATGSLSRNREVGLQLARGRALTDVLRELGHVAEGVYTAPTVLARARALGVEMPITEAVVAVLDGRLSPAQALAQLMRRDARAETPDA